MILYFGLRKLYFKKFKTNLKSYTILYPIFGLSVLAVIVFLGIQAYEYTESPEFCAEVCHSMKPYTDTYENPGNNTILGTHRENDIGCADCHNGPGISGTIKTRMDGLNMVFAEWTNNYDPDDFQGNVPNEHCEKGGCHNGLDWEINTTTGPIFHPFTNDGKSSPKTGEQCTSCHNPRLGGTGLTKKSCVLCHEITTDELKLHESRTCGQTTCHGTLDESGHRPGRKPIEDACINCHNRKHPEDARVPFDVVNLYEREGVKINLTVNNEFCSDCHRTEYDKFTAVNPGECQDCHVEHEEEQSPHQKPTEDAFECKNCHIRMTPEYDHDPRVVTFKNVIFDLKNDFCSDCHKDEFDVYSMNNQGKCTDCHSNHEPSSPAHLLPSTNYDDCKKCHIGMTNKHDISIVAYENFPSSEIDNKLCSSCHFTEFTFYTNSNTGKCTECHVKHESPQPPHVDDETVEECKNCHMDIIDNHDPRNVSFINYPSSELQNEFCNTCHGAIYDAYTKNSTPDTIAVYGNCTTCHVEHKDIKRPHRNEAPYDTCADCHSKYDANIKTHDPSGIDYKTYPGTVENEFCSDCHQNQYISLTNTSDTDRKHSKRECTDCHTEHKTLKVEFNKCSVCHNVPSSHDEDRTNCKSCHDVERYIHDL